MAITTDDFNGVPKQDYKDYVKVRLNVFLQRLGLPTRYRVKDCSVEGWFEKNTYAYKQIDFFTAGVGMEYESNWSDSALGSAWRKKDE